LGANLYKTIADNPNYSMANLQRQDNQQGQKLDPAVGTAIWGMDQDMNGAARSKQEPVSYEYGMPAPAVFDFSGSAWDPLKRADFGTWASRQYNDPEIDFTMPWEQFGHYIKVINPLTEVPGLPPLWIPLLPPVVYFALDEFVGDLMMPMFYPMIYRRYETFAHSDAATNAIDASVIRSDYNFTAPSIGSMPVVGQVIAGVLSSLVPVIAGVDSSLTSNDIKSTLDMLTNTQSNAMAPRMVETEAGGFFAATQALQDWDLDNMEYQYYSATNYQEDFIDTDYLAAMRTAGAKLFKIIVNALLNLIPGFNNPIIALIKEPLLDFISNQMMSKLMAPIRKFIEVDTQYQRTGAGAEAANDSNTIHVGDPGGLFGLVGAAWEPAGYALSYRSDTATSVKALNSVTVYTNRKKIDNLWDGRGVLVESDWQGTTFQSTGSRLHNVGYATNPPLNLSTFRYNVQDRFGAGANDFDASPETDANRTTQAHGIPGTYDRKDDYWVKAETKFGDQIQTGTRTLNPSFGGGVRITDLDTNLDDIFYYGSAAFLPDHGKPGGPIFGDTNQITLSGGNFQARNAGWSEGGTEYLAAQLPEVAAPPTTPNSNNYSLAKMGTVTFDGISATTNAYVFASKDDNGAAITGLKVQYRGPDTLTGPSNAQPVNIMEARRLDNYRVTNLNGNPITAEVLVAQDQVRIHHGDSPPGVVAASDWVMANSTYDQKFRTPQSEDANNNWVLDAGEDANNNHYLDRDADILAPTSDDRTTDWGQLNMGLNVRLEPLFPQAVNPRRDDDVIPASSTVAGNNLTSAQLIDPAVTDAILTSHLGAPGTPGSGASWQKVNEINLSGPLAGWTSWKFVPGADQDYNGNGAMGGAVNAAFGNSIESGVGKDKREAWIAFDRLISQMVPASFFRKETVSGTASDDWNMRVTPYNPNSGTAGNYDVPGAPMSPPNPPGVTLPAGFAMPLPTTYAGAGVRPATSTNPYYWVNGNYEYVAVWSNRDLNADGKPDERNANGLPTATSYPVAVYRYDRSGGGSNTIELLGSNVVGAPKLRLMHRETQIMTMDDDSALGASSKFLRTLDHLRASTYTQGRNQDDTTGALYSTAGVSSTATLPVPPAGTPGDFMIMNRQPGKSVTLAFTRPYAGLVDVPPNVVGGFPKEDWTAVNGWWVSQTNDGNVGTVTIPPGSEGSSKLWWDKSVLNNTENIWAIQDFSYPTIFTAVSTEAGDTGWTSAGFGTTYGAIWSAFDFAGRDETSLGRKFSITNVGAGPHYVRVRADDGAAVFINGKFIGQGVGYSAWTTLAIPVSDLRPGENIVTIQAIDRGGPAGVEAEVVVNGAQVANTSPAQASQWQVLDSPAVSTPDEFTLSKSVTLTAPNGTMYGAAAPDGVLTGDILPGEFLDISWTGANAGARQAQGIHPATWYQVNGSWTSSDRIGALIPDRAVLTVTNGKFPAGMTVPLTQHDSASDRWNIKDEGSGIFHVPSDYLASGANTFDLSVERGGKAYQFAMNEPPSAAPTGWLYRNLAQGPIQAAGYWVNSSNLLDDDGTTVLVPVGSLLYGGKVVATTAGGAFGVINGIIHRDLPLVGWDAVKPSDFAFKPDSYFSRNGSTIGGNPLFDAASGGDKWSGYQLKSDVRSGMTVGNADPTQQLHTYATKHYDRYVFDANTQTIMDILAANQNGLEGTSILAPGGSENQDVPYTGSPDKVNTQVPLMLPPNGTVLRNNGVPDPTGREVIPGTTGIAKAPVGIRITKQDRQTFGSDDNELTRTLYAAMKPIDIDGVNEDRNGNGVLDVGEDANSNGVLDKGALEADARAYREYRDVFNYGLLDHIYISGSAYSPTGGGFSSTIEFGWKQTDVKVRTTDHVSGLGTAIQDTVGKTTANAYLNNYEYFANETDRRNRKYTVIRRGDVLMNSFYSFRKEQ
jgi:hypothetical protein